MSVLASVYNTWPSRTWSIIVEITVLPLLLTPNYHRYVTSNIRTDSTKLVLKAHSPISNDLVVWHIPALDSFTTLKHYSNICRRVNYRRRRNPGDKLAEVFKNFVRKSTMPHSVPNSKSTSLFHLGETILS